MKLWSERSKKDKAARIVLSIGILGFVGYGVPKAGFEVYDFYTADGCRAELQAAVSAGLEANTNIAYGGQGDTALAFAARDFAAKVQAIRCPTAIAGAQDELVRSLVHYAELHERMAQGASASYDERAATTEAVGKALQKLQALGVDLGG